MSNSRIKFYLNNACDVFLIETESFNLFRSVKKAREFSSITNCSIEVLSVRDF